MLDDASAQVLPITEEGSLMSHSLYETENFVFSAAVA